MDKLKYVAVTWLLVIFAYIILAVMMPVLTGMAGNASTELQATSNMSAYPGMLGVIETSPIWMWFVPGGIGIIATAIFLKKN